MLPSLAAVSACRQSMALLRFDQLKDISVLMTTVKIKEMEEKLRTTEHSQ